MIDAGMMPSPSRGLSKITRGMSWRLPLGWLGIVCVAGLWQLVAVVVNASVLPTFTSAIRTAWTLVDSSVLTADILPSIERTLIGFALSAVLGVAAGLLVGYSRRISEWTATVIDFMRSLPAPLLIPVALTILGLGSNMVILIITLAAVWPVLINTAEAVRGIDQTLIDSARMYGVRGAQLFVKVLLVAASPMIFAGMRIALSVSLAVMVVAEMLGGGSGIGYYIAYAQQTFRVTGSYAGIIVLCLIGWLFDTVFVAVERRLLAWERGLSGALGAE